MITYQLHHVSRPIITGIHDVFPPDKDEKEDSISLKKILKKEDSQATIKNVLGFESDENPGEHTIWLTEDIRTDILTKLKRCIREEQHRKKGIPFEKFRTYLAKLRYAFVTIPYGKWLLFPCNQILGKEPNDIFLNRNKPLLSAICDCCHLLEMSAKNPTPCKSLVTGWTHYIGVKYASSHGIGSIIMGLEKACIPTVFRLAWQDDIKELFHKGNIKIRIWEWQGY